ncbi:recombinase family protein [Micromonospora zamorensis]|uniref:recombinase family protein n=1 Tax=Micromonospora zamorensis TaxID=709883 RepID=UPI0033A5E651
MRWNTRDKWVVSKEITHPPLIDDETFERAQALLTRRARAVDRQERQRRARNPYVFRGMIYCATRTTKPRSTGNSDCDSPTRPKRKRCALKSISARTVK